MVYVRPSQTGHTTGQSGENGELPVSYFSFLPSSHQGGLAAGPREGLLGYSCRLQATFSIGSTRHELSARPVCLSAWLSTSYRQHASFLAAGAKILSHLLVSCAEYSSMHIGLGIKGSLGDSLIGGGATVCHLRPLGQGMA